MGRSTALVHPGRGNLLTHREDLRTADGNDAAKTAGKMKDTRIEKLTA